MKLETIEKITQSATGRRSEPAHTRLATLPAQEQELVSYWAVLSEAIRPEEALVFLNSAGFDLTQAYLDAFIECALSQGVLVAAVQDGNCAPFFSVEEELRRHLAEGLAPEQVQHRHALADAFYRSAFIVAWRELGDCAVDETAGEEALAMALTKPGGIIDLGVHLPQAAGFHAWCVGRAYYWQEHLFALGRYDQAAEVANTICFALARQGHRQAAKELVARSAAFTTGLQQGASLANLGTLFRQEMEHRPALKLYWRALACLLPHRSAAQIAAVFSEMSNVYRDTGGFLRALLFQILSSLTRRLTKDAKGQAICQNQLSILYRSLGWYGLALRAGQSAEAYWRRVCDEANLAKTLTTQGNSFNQMGRPDQALVCFAESLEINRRLHDMPEVASALSGQARAHLQMQHYGEARPLLEEAIDLRRRSNSRLIGVEYQNMGLLFEAQNDLRQALGWYKKALANLEKYQPAYAHDCMRKIQALEHTSR